jgi:formate dehydrogenase subunit gamma
MSAFEPAVREAPAAHDRLERHRPIDRAYHWLMAASVLTLMATAFLPIVGWKFDWLTLHWTTGLVLAALVLGHIVRALIWQDWRAMVVDAADFRNAARAAARLFARRGLQPGKPGKYTILQKLYHWTIAGLILAIIASGLAMLLKIDTPLWRRDPYWFTTDTWGIIYSVHDFAAMAMITMLMIHVYFALRPEELWLTRSMLRGWVSRDEYVQHCDDSRWVASKKR